LSFLTLLLSSCLFSAIFFFSSRRRHTRFSRDWSSDVCSSDLHVAGLATSRGLDQMADAIWLAATRWRRQITTWLHGVQEQRGVRGAQCPDCEATHVTDDRPGDGRVLIPAVVLVDRDLDGNRLQWLACLACGWSRGLADLADLATAGAAP